MHVALRQCASSPSHLPLRLSVASKNTMLRRAVDSHASTAATTNVNQQPQRPVHTGGLQKTFHIPNGQNPLGVNKHVTGQQTHPPKSTSRRIFDRATSTTSTSSLSQLHDQVWFDENDFDDDDAIDLDYKLPQKTSAIKSSGDVKYPSLNPARVHYPSLPSQNSPLSQRVTSSAPVPWSSSPAAHWEKPGAISTSNHETVPIEISSDERPTKRRKKLPWEQDKDFTPLPKDEDETKKFPWNRSPSAVKQNEKDLRKRNTARLTTTKTSHEKQATIPATHLSDEQLAVAKSVVDDGRSVFFTGSAGTGKSVLMRSIIARLRQKYSREPDRLAITASTGLAACVIEGTTLHSWSGIGLGKDPVPELVKRIKRNAKTKTKWLRTKALIIDEISMVDAALFDKLEAIARTIRNNGLPFGGIQLVVTGDFFQLPPVPEKNSIAKFAFDAATWNTCIQHTILLTHVFRQKDPIFAGMLNEMRLGKLGQDSINSFKKLSRPLDFHDELEATELFPLRTEVEAANKHRMERLSGQVMTYQATDSGVKDDNVRNRLLSSFMAPETLTLKKGAQVMLIKNIDTQLVNGTCGKVIAFMDESCYAAYKEDEETYHRAHEPDGVGNEEEKNAAKAKWNVAKFKNKEGASTRYWPMVRFPLPDGTYRDLLCIPEEWKMETQQGEIAAKRVQVPLILAWALSIHKAQGQTLSRVKVDLGKVFEKGQAYVALSRATSQAGLQVLRFDAKKVMVHPKVIQFYEQLVSIDSIQGNAAERRKKGSTTSEQGRNYAAIDDDEDLFMDA